MTVIFCIRPTKRNIGNDLISLATSDLLYAQFGSETLIVDIPALEGDEFGGLTARQVYDINRFADGVVIGGGNLFENGQLTVDLQALEALRPPMMIMGLSHGRIYGRSRELVWRTDSMPAEKIRKLVNKSLVTLVRDRASALLLEEITRDEIAVGGCPSMFMPRKPPEHESDQKILVSIRHPGRMSVPADLQWRIAEDLRRLLVVLKERHPGKVQLVCHDYKDIEFAAGFPDVPCQYYDDVQRYILALRQCRCSITYRLHAFLPCLAFGTPSIHLSYDERGKQMVATAGMADWDIDLVSENNVVDAVLARMDTLADYHALRSRAQPVIHAMRETTSRALDRFAEALSSARLTRPTEEAGR